MVSHNVTTLIGAVGPVLVVSLCALVFISAEEALADWSNQRNITGIENFDDMQFDNILTNQSNIVIGSSGIASIWDYLHESKLTYLPGNGSINSYRISEDGETIAVGYSGYRTGIVLRIINRSTLEISSEYPIGEFASISAIDWISEDLLALGQSDGNISVLALSTGKIEYYRTYDGKNIKEIRASPGGQFLAVAFEHDTVIIDWENDTEHLMIRGNSPIQLSWSYDSEYLAISSIYDDSTVISIDDLQNVWVGGFGDIIEFAPHANSFLLEYGGKREFVIYDLEGEDIEFDHHYSDGSVMKLRWNQNGSVFSVAFNNQIIRFFFNSSLFPMLAPPTVKITSPIDGADVFGSTQIIGTARHPLGIQFVLVRVDKNPWQLAEGTNIWSISLNLSLYSKGSHIITALSSTGFKTSPYHQIFVNVLKSTANVSRPMVNITYPGNHSTIRNSVFIKGHSWGELAINYVEISVDNNAWQIALGTYDWRYYLDIDTFKDGNHSIRARSVNAIYISNFVEIQIQISREVNDLPILILKTPEPSSTISDVVIFEGTATDTDGIRSVQYSILNTSSAWITTDGLSDWSFSINTNLLSNGPVTVRIRAFDTKSASSIHDFHFSVYNSVRYVGIKIIHPEYNKKTVYGNVIINGTFDNHQILDRAMFYIMDYGVEIIPDGSYWSVELDTNRYPNGNHSILIIAISTYGLLTYKELIIDVQNIYKPPKIVISSPENNSVLDANFIIEGSAEDSLIVERVQYSVDNVEWINCTGTNQWSCLIDIEPLKPGPHQFSVRGYNGYVYSKPVILTLELEKEEADVQGDINIYVLLISILTTVIISLIILYLRERKRG